MTDDNESQLFGDSRRSFMKKGALATTALALGASATAGTAAAQDGDGEVVVFGDDYMPDVEFTVASALDSGTRDEVMENTELTEEFDTPEDWDVYIISYDTGGSSPSIGHLFSEEVDLSSGDSETMGTDASFRNAEMNLLEVSLGGGAGEGDDMEEEEEAADNESADNESDGGGGGMEDNGGGGGGGN